MVLIGKFEHLDVLSVYLDDLPFCLEEGLLNPVAGDFLDAHSSQGDPQFAVATDLVTIGSIIRSTVFGERAGEQTVRIREKTPISTAIVKALRILYIAALLGAVEFVLYKIDAKAPKNVPGIFPLIYSHIRSPLV